MKEVDGVIEVSCMSDGWNGAQWKEYFEEKEIRIGPNVKDVLSSPDFKPTPNGVVTKIAILTSPMLFKNFPGDRMLHPGDIHREAKKRGLVLPNADIACLLRKQFSNEDIMAAGLKGIRVMHEGLYGHYVVDVGVSCFVGSHRTSILPYNLDIYAGEYDQVGTQIVQSSCYVGYSMGFAFAKK